MDERPAAGRALSGATRYQAVGVRAAGVVQECSVRMYWARSKAPGSSTLPWLALPRSWRDGGVLVLDQPGSQLGLDLGDRPGPSRRSAEAMAADVSPDHDGLHHVLAAVDAGGGRDAHLRAQLRPQDGRPAHAAGAAPTGWLRLTRGTTASSSRSMSGW